MQWMSTLLHESKVVFHLEGHVRRPCSSPTAVAAPSHWTEQNEIGVVQTEGAARRDEYSKILVE